MLAVHPDLERKLEAAKADDEIQALVHQLKDIYEYNPGESLAALAYRSFLARRVSAKLDALLRKKHQLSLKDVEEIYRRVDRDSLAEVAATSET